MDKPQPETVTQYDFMKCRTFVDEKYGIDQNDYAGRWKKGQHNEDAPYQDFWHFIVERGDVHNDSTFTMFESWGEDAEDWQKLILGYYMDEFGSGATPERSIAFSISW